jgi:hypothetical protein
MVKELSLNNDSKLSKQEFIEFLLNTDISINVFDIYSKVPVEKLKKSVSYILEERSHVLVKLHIYTEATSDCRCKYLSGQIYTSYDDGYKELVSIGNAMKVNNEVFCDKDLDPSIIHQIVLNDFGYLECSVLPTDALNHDMYLLMLKGFVRLLNYVLSEKQEYSNYISEAIFFDIKHIGYENEQKDSELRAVLFGLLNPVGIADRKYIRYLDLFNIFTSKDVVKYSFSKLDNPELIKRSKSMLDPFEMQILKKKILDFKGGE